MQVGNRDIDSSISLSTGAQIPPYPFALQVHGQMITPSMSRLAVALRNGGDNLAFGGQCESLCH